MLHPVGPLPAAVYWRRRLVVLLLLAAVIGGLAWGAVALLDRRDAGDAPAGAATTTELPALERVVPSVTALRTPEAPTAAPAPPPPTVEPAPVTPAAGGPCTDDMVGLEVRTPGQVAAGSKPTFELVLTNISPVPCVRALDKELQELVLVDAAGARVWGSNDCFPEATDEPRLLAPGEAVVVPLLWGGLTSEPTCTAPRVPPAPGSYVVRGRLDTKASGDAPLVIG